MPVSDGASVSAMTTPERPVRIDMREQNKGIIAAFRANGGQLVGLADPLVLLTTIGAKSSHPHTTPVCVREDNGRLVVAGSVGGQPDHPQWYKNLVANPELTVEYLGDTYQARATTVENSPDRDRLFDMMSKVIVGIYGYQDRCRDDRQIPIVSLDRI
jgi:deazaflavin-dependent oxidoreductase (nitroreductase family)